MTNSQHKPSFTEFLLSGGPWPDKFVEEINRRDKTPSPKELTQLAICVACGYSGVDHDHREGD